LQQAGAALKAPFDERLRRIEFPPPAVARER